MFDINCYEGINKLEDINKLNNRQIEIEYIGDYEKESLQLISDWENKINSLNQ